MHLINNPVFADSDSPRINQHFHLLATGRKWVVSQSLDLGDDAPLNLTRQFLQLSKSKGFELNGVGHDRRLS